MKSTLFTIFLFTLSVQIFGQSKRFNIGVEYSPNFANVTDNSTYAGSFFSTNPGFRLAHNMFLKAGYNLNNHFELTTGFGYLNTREFDRVPFNGQLEIDAIESIRTHHYLMVPFGVNYHFGSFFIHPEVGLGLNIDNTTAQTSYLSNGSVVHQRYQDDYNNTYINKFTVPAFLTLGNEIKVGSSTILLGVKGYYSFNNIADIGFRSNHYYGFGVVTGVKF